MMLFFRIYKIKIIMAAILGVAVMVMIMLGGLLGFAKLDSYTKDMHRKNMKPMSELSIIHTSFIDIRRTFWKIAALRDSAETKAELIKIQYNINKIDDIWDDYYTQGIASGQEQIIADSLKLKLPHFKEISNKATYLINSGNYSEATSYLHSEIDYFKEIDEIISYDIALNESQLSAFLDKSSDLFSLIFWSTLTIIGFVICIVAGFSLYLMRQRDDAVNESHYNLWLANEVVAYTENGVLVTDAKGLIQKINPAFTRLTGYTQTDVLGRNPSMLTSKRQSPEFYQQLWRSLAEKGEWKGEMWNCRKSGALYLQSLLIKAIRAYDGKTSHYVGVFSDITERQLAEDRLSHLATHDALTGLPNRALFNERLGQAIARAKRGLWQVAVMFLDLDRFKSINDTLGHKIGDGVLIAVARRLKQPLRETDTVARLGGDEFVVILEDVTEIAHITSVAQALLQSVGQAIDIDDCSVSTTPSIGVSLYPVDGEDAKLLIERADLAMYEAKKAGKNTFRFYKDIDVDTLHIKEIY